MWAQPRAQQRPEAFHRIDMHFVETITVFIAGVLSRAVANALVNLSPLGKGIINHIFIGVDYRARFDRLLDKRVDGVLLHVF